MDIKLISLIIGSFKGLKKFQVEFDDDSTIIKAQNGIGKTTVFDAFLWLLFNKDSTGRKDFEVRPLDKDNQPIKGLVTSVIAELSIGDEFHVLKKELHENIVKKQLRGYTTACTIDEVPKKVSEYADYITELIPEETFKLLTDLDYFNAKMHWKERRKVLLGLADYDAPKGFEKLHELLNGRTIEDLKKVLSGQKKGYEDEQKEINPRMDEIQQSLDSYTSEDLPDTKTLEAQRTIVTQEISKLRVDRQNLTGKETERQKKIDALNELHSQKMNRESALRNDPSGVTALLEEKSKREIVLAEKQSEVGSTLRQIETEKNNQASVEANLNRCLALRNELNEQKKQIKEEPVDGTCYACGQKLPADKLVELEAGRQAKLAEINKQGFELKTVVENCRKKIEATNQNILTLQKVFGQANSELELMITSKDARFAVIDEAIKNNPTTPPEKDNQWLVTVELIEKAEKEIGLPVGEQLGAIETMRINKELALERINKLLNNHDNITKASMRITELSTREKELAQLIADVESQLAMIDDYNVAESKAIETAVNGRFEHVEFKLFSDLLNGSIEECCELMLDGIPYKDLSSGQKIFSGLDVVNVLSKHYTISTPLFIDHLESVTLPIKTKLQTIGLKAVAGIKELTVEIEK